MNDNTATVNKNPEYLTHCVAIFIPEKDLLVIAVKGWNVHKQVFHKNMHEHRH